jgi:hypothetical protein
MRHAIPALILAALPFAALPAQQAHSGPDPDRKTSTVHVGDDRVGTLVAAAISYAPANWQDSYDDVLKQGEASNYTRIGKGWWTTLDTVGAIEIGGTRLEAGSYYLGLAVDKSGAFVLLVFDSMQTMKAGLLPATTALYRGEGKPVARVPLTLAKDARKEVVVQMEIEISIDKKDLTTGRFAIRWGRHELSAPVKFHHIGAKTAGAEKK